jgi:hypothetical protein
VGFYKRKLYVGLHNDILLNSISISPPPPPLRPFPTKLLDYHETIDVLAVMMMDSVFSAHLTYEEPEFHLDLTSLEKYTPLPGYAKLGGKATFVWDKKAKPYPRMRTVRLDYGGKSYVPKDDDAVVNAAYAKSTLVGWRFAEKAIIASLLSMTNLVMHVKDLHLEVRVGRGLVSD